MLIDLNLRIGSITYQQTFLPLTPDLSDNTPVGTNMLLLTVWASLINTDIWAVGLNPNSSFFFLTCFYSGRQIHQAVFWCLIEAADFRNRESTVQSLGAFQWSHDSIIILLKIAAYLRGVRSAKHLSQSKTQWSAACRKTWWVRWDSLMFRLICHFFTIQSDVPAC